jgi:putative DNA primase/helicase
MTDNSALPPSENQGDEKEPVPPAPENSGDDESPDPEKSGEATATENSANKAEEAPQTPKPGDEITSNFVMECLQAEQLGDGMLFAELLRGQFVFNKITQEWLSWQGHHWEVDLMDKAKMAVETVALRYGQEMTRLRKEIAEASAKEEKDREKFLKDLRDYLNSRVKRLRKSTGRINCLEFAHTGPNGSSLAIRGDELDQNPWLLGMKNGIMDLRTGELRPGRYDDWICKACNVEWDSLEAPRPTWENFLWESLEHQATIDFLRRWAGYCLTAMTTEQKFLILAGEGRNGKGVFVETLLEIMGEYAGPIKVEMLLDQGARQGANSVTPDVMSLMGRRLAAASESDEGRRFSASKIKWFTGGDMLVGRNPYDRRETSFPPTHKLMLMTNNDPQAPADDRAFWDRVLKVDWKYKFLDTPRHDDEKQRDPRLREKLREELPGIMAWVVQGCLEWQHQGLDPPGCVLEAVTGYQREQDIIQDFIDGRCYVNLDDQSLTTSGGDLYAAFKDWFMEYHNKARAPSITWFGRRMAKKFKKSKGAVVQYHGVGLLSAVLGEST